MQKLSYKDSSKILIDSILFLCHDDKNIGGIFRFVNFLIVTTDCNERVKIIEQLACPINLETHKLLIALKSC